MKTLTTAILAALMTSTLAVSACASKPERRGPPQDGERRGGERGDRPQKSAGTFMLPIAALFTAMDTDNDKRTSLAEMRAGAASEWSGFSQSPSAIYFSDWILKTLGSRDSMPTFMSFDRDFSGVISEAEFADQIEREFTRLDKNKDGHVDRSEMLIVFAAQRGRDTGRSDQGGRGQRGGQGGGRPPR